MTSRLIGDIPPEWKRRRNDSPNRPSSTSVSLAKFYPPRPREARKGDYGRVVIAGGSEKYSGCLGLSALAALRAGVDLAVVVAPRRAADIVAGFSPDLITMPSSSPYPDPKLVGEALIGSDALVLGCGVVRTPVAHKALLSIIREASVPIVADAEALHAIATKPSVCKGKRILLTPNGGEFKILSNDPWPKSASDRARAVRELASRYKSTVIVKGADDYVSDGARVHVDRESSPYLTKGGYGDLLSGVSGAMLARGNSSFDAARAAAYIVGRAGGFAARNLGESTLASDALAEIPMVV